MTANTAPRPKRRRRWILRIALALLVLVVLIGALGPILAAPIVRSMLVERMNATLDARASLDELTFNFGGSLHAAGFALEDAEAEPLASMGSLDAKLSVLALARGRFELDVTLVGFELDVRRGPDGGWNFERVMKPSDEPAPAPEEPAAEPGELPRVRAHVELRDGRVRVHSEEGVTALEDVRFTLALDDLEQRAPFALTARVVGPGGAGGAVDVHGELALARDGRIGPDTIEAVLEATIDALEVAELGPLVALASGSEAPPRIASGVLGVTSNVRIGGGQTLDADFELALDGLALDGPAGPFALEALRVGARAQLDAVGTGTHELTVALDGHPWVVLRGETRDLRAEDGRVVGELTANANLRGLAELARLFAPMDPGHELAGALAAEGRWDLPASTAKGAGTLSLNARLDELEVRDESGRALGLGGGRAPRFELAVSLDGEGERIALESRFDLERLAVSGPSLDADGVELRGLSFALDGSSTRSGSPWELDSATFGLERLAGALPAAEEGGAPLSFELGAMQLSLEGSGEGDGSVATLGVTLARALVRGLVAEDVALSALSLRVPGLSFDAATGIAKVPELSLALPGIDVMVRGTMSGFAGDSPEPVAELRIEPRVELAELDAWAAPLLQGMSIGGSLLDGHLDVRLASGVVAAAGELGAERLELYLPPEAEDGAARELVQEAVKVSFDVEHDPARDAGRLDLRALHLASSTGEIDASGAITSASEPGAAQAELELGLRGALERVLHDFADFVPVQGVQGSGALEVTAQITGGARAARVTGDLRAASLDLVVPIEGASEPVRIHELARGTEPGFACTLALDVEGAGEAVVFEGVALDSETLRGELTGRWFGVPADQPEARARFEALKGDFTYVPERLAAWIQPWLPGGLRGKERLPLEFLFEGELDDGDTLAMLRALRGDARLELGEVEVSGLVTSGTITLGARGDRIDVFGALGANGGKLDFSSQLDLRASAVAGAEPVSSAFRVNVVGVGARPELAPLLTHVHPMFGALERAGAGSLAGKISSYVELKYGAPLSNEVLSGGYAALAKRAIGGLGNLQLEQLSLDGSPLLASMVSLIDPQGGGSLALDPLSFSIRDGRLGYDKPWQWTIAGSPTKFSGTLGLDGSLDMAWQVPVTPALVQRHGFLSYFAGETIEVPLKGTTQRPSLSLQATLDGLAKTALERELKERAGGILPDLGDILGGGGGGAGSSPDQLLQRADDLYSKGDKVEAAKLYAEIKKRHLASLTYLLNKSRIDSRSREQ